MQTDDIQDDDVSTEDPMAKDLAALGETAATEEDVLKQIDNEIASDLLGDSPTILGMDLRPVTLATISLLMRVGSDLVAGKPVEECDDLLMDCGVFLVIHSRSLKEARDITRDRDDLEDTALELLDDLAPGDAQDVINTITRLLQESTQTQVVPVNDEDSTELPSEKEMTEGEG